MLNSQQKMINKASVESYTMYLGIQILAFRFGRSDWDSIQTKASHNTDTSVPFFYILQVFPKIRPWKCQTKCQGHIPSEQLEAVKRGLN